MAKPPVLEGARSGGDNSEEGKGRIVVKRSPYPFLDMEIRSEDSVDEQAKRKVNREMGGVPKNLSAQQIANVLVLLYGAAEIALVEMEDSVFTNSNPSEIRKVLKKRASLEALF